MNKALSLCAALFLVLPPLVMAEGPGLEEQIAGVQAEITVAQQVNIELKTQLDAKETEVSELKVKLTQIEDQIETLKKELPLQSK